MSSVCSSSLLLSRSNRSRVLFVSLALTKVKLSVQTQHWAVLCVQNDCLVPAGGVPKAPVPCSPPMKKQNTVSNILPLVTVDFWAFDHSFALSHCSVAEMANIAPRPCLFTHSQAQSHQHSASWLLLWWDQWNSRPQDLSHADSLSLSPTAHSASLLPLSLTVSCLIRVPKLDSLTDLRAYFRRLWVNGGMCRRAPWNTGLRIGRRVSNYLGDARWLSSEIL